MVHACFRPIPGSTIDTRSQAGTSVIQVQIAECSSQSVAGNINKSDRSLLVFADRVNIKKNRFGLPRPLCFDTVVPFFVNEPQDKGFSYSRTANPTVSALEAKVAGLEGAAGACCVSTGMAATVTVMSAFLKAGKPI